MSNTSNFGKEFWDQRYENNQTQWDTGSITQPLKSYFDQLPDKSIKILIPGAGNSYEAEYLHNKGFPNVFVADLSLIPLQNLKSRIPTFPETNLLHENFFNLQGNFDLIIEQTFFCALDPKLRNQYVKKCHQLLNEGGKVVGLLFNLPLNADQPPFGGNLESYTSIFKKYFDFKYFSTCYNSIKPREGNEIFINVIKKPINNRL